MALGDWIGREEVRESAVPAAVANMIGATLNDDWDPVEGIAPGAPMPPLWHWMAFHPAVGMTEIGTDGHPKLGGFLPPVPLERRMWAAGKLTFQRPLHVGERLRRHSRIANVEEKTGGAGSMVFVTVQHELEGESGPAISEEQNIVYIAIPEEFRPPKPIPAPEAPDFDILVPIDVVRLFRFSAATFNAHRIHYDLAYTTEVEKYPGLVIHGPLQAMLLMEAAIRHRGSPPKEYSFRGVHPMFHTHDLRLVGVDKDDGAMELCTAAPDGHQGLQARARWG